MALRAELLVRLTARETGANDFGGPAFEPTLELLMQLASGTGANQADIAFFDERSINAASNDDLDLAGALSSAFGATIAAAELVAILIVNKPRDPAAPANVSDLTIGGGANPVVGFLAGTSPAIGPIRPGGVLLLAAPAAAGLGLVTAATGDILRIANGAGGTAKVQVGILARSA